MTYYFWLGEDAIWANQIEEDYEGDWESYTEDQEMRSYGY